MPVTASDEFWEEARRLAELAGEAMAEVGKRGVDVIQLLASLDAKNVNPQVKAIIEGAQEKNGRYIKTGGDLTDQYGELLQAYRTENDFYIISWQQVLARNKRVDAEKVANKELLDLMEQARQTMESTPAAIRTLVAAASIAQSSQFLYYADLLNALLQYPTKFRQAMDAAGTLANAAVMDLAGTAFPFLGTVAAAVDIIFDLKKPQINKKIEELSKATDDVNRIANFGDQLAELLDYADFAGNVMRLADGTMKSTHASFEIQTSWLSAVLGNAKR